MQNPKLVAQTVYDATVARTSLKIASSILSIFFNIKSICLTFESYRNYPGTEFIHAVSKLEKKIQIGGCVFMFSVKLEKWSFHVADLPRTEKKCTYIKKAREGRAKLLFLGSLNMQNLWRCRCLSNDEKDGQT